MNIAEAIFNSVNFFDSSLIHVCLANSEWSKFLKSKKVKLANEGFADRAYDENGYLVSRSIKGSVLHNKNEIIEKPLINETGDNCTEEKIKLICQLITRLQFLWIIIFALIFFIISRLIL